MNEVYYFDGEAFRKCLFISSIKVPMNKDYEDLAYIINNENIEAFLTLGKIEKRCLYELENVKAHMHILTSRGFELITTEEMNVRAMGLATKDIVNVIVRPVLMSKITEKLNFEGQNLEQINASENVVVLVIKNINEMINEVYTLTQKELININSKEEVLIELNQ